MGACGNVKSTSPSEHVPISSIPSIAGHQSLPSHFPSSIALPSSISSGPVVVVAPCPPAVAIATTPPSLPPRGVLPPPADDNQGWSPRRIHNPAKLLYLGIYEGPSAPPPRTTLRVVTHARTRPPPPHTQVATFVTSTQNG